VLFKRNDMYSIDFAWKVPNRFCYFVLIEILKICSCGSQAFNTKKGSSVISLETTEEPLAILDFK
jgi:hypothetical protein